MRSSRIASIVAVVGGAFVTGCGGMSDGDRDEIAGLVRAYLVAEDRGDDAAFCRTLTRELQAAYAAGPDGEAGRASGCPKAHARQRAELQRLEDDPTPDPDDPRNSAAVADALRRVRGREADLARAVRSRSNVTIDEEDGRVVVTVRGRRFRDQHVVQRDDGAWRIGMGPETATLR